MNHGPVIFVTSNSWTTLSAGGTGYWPVTGVQSLSPGRGPSSARRGTHFWLLRAQALNSPTTSFSKLSPHLIWQAFSLGEPVQLMMHVRFAAQLGLRTHLAKGTWHLLRRHGATAAILELSATATRGARSKRAAASSGPRQFEPAPQPLARGPPGAGPRRSWPGAPQALGACEQGSGPVQSRPALAKPHTWPRELRVQASTAAARRQPGKGAALLEFRVMDAPSPASAAPGTCQLAGASR
mmetsp:Transcript_50174/g.160605  ORF Transcript_50174/g.160605 Transcript_50174/m.160605 type:complete len:240 (+) Transcript_50174:1046-1765(+)